MNGIHDLGGMHGFGPVGPESHEPVFHHPWEGRVFAMTLATGFLGRWNLDLSRSAREEMPAAEYLSTGYYEHWLFGLERLLEERGLVTGPEIEARIRDPRSAARSAPEGTPRALGPEDVARALRAGPGARSPDPVPPRFRASDPVRARNLHPEGHTRLPRYCRGRRGIVQADHGVWIFPDTHARGLGPKPQHLYSVSFAATELWGPAAPPQDRVLVDLWEDYLEPPG